MSMVSVLHLFSYGQVVADNTDQSRTIKVKVLEHGNSRYGVPSAEIMTDDCDVEHFLEKIKGDGKGNEEFVQRIISVNVSFKDFVPANWLNRSANRISPPKVVVGQRVLLWRVGDSNQYYWEELDVDMRLKPDEHIIIAINNNNKGKQLDLDNAYIIEASTRDSRIRVRTNRNNSEKAAFEVDINGGEGYLKLMDDCAGSKRDYRGNGILIDSVNTKVVMQNVAGTSYILDGGDILTNCPGNRTATIGGSDTVNASSLVVEAGVVSISGKTEFADEVEFISDVTGGKAAWSIKCTAPNI